MLTDPTKVVCELCGERFRWDEGGSKCSHCGAEYVFLGGDAQDGPGITPAWGALILSPIWVMLRIRELELLVGELVDAQNVDAGPPVLVRSKMRAWYSVMIKACKLLEREDHVAFLTEEAKSWGCK